MNVAARILLCGLVTVLALMADPPWRPADAAGPNQVFTITPCRAVDTRLAGGVIPERGSRNFNVVGTLLNQGGQATCGVPVGAQAVFLNIVAVAPSAAGHLTVYPWPGPLPPTSTLNFSGGQTVANGALTPICDPNSMICSSDLIVTMGPASAHLVIDVTGYLLGATSGGTGGTAPSITVGWFKIASPYQWHNSSGPMPIQIGAMIDDGTPQPAYTGTVTVGMMSPLLGTLLTLYDSNMHELPSFQTTAFVGGAWYGYVWLKTATGSTQDIGLSAADTLIHAGGNSNVTTWYVP